VSRNPHKCIQIAVKAPFKCTFRFEKMKIVKMTQSILHSSGLMDLRMVLNESLMSICLYFRLRSVGRCLRFPSSTFMRTSSHMLLWEVVAGAALYYVLRQKKFAVSYNDELGDLSDFTDVEGLSKEFTYDLASFAIIAFKSILN
jgi:hypothetical protein